MNYEFTQKTVIDLEPEEYRGYKTKLISRKDLAPCLFFTPKSFKQYQEDNDVEVVGTVKIGQKSYKDTFNSRETMPQIEKKVQKGIKGICYISSSKSLEVIPFDLYNNKPRNTRTVGYASVGNGEYVRLVKHNPIWIVWLIIIALVIICGLRGCGNDTNTPFDVTPGNEITTTAPTYENYMANNHFLYVWKTKTVTKDKPTVALINHPDNDVYLCYDIYSTDGEILDSTGAFEPNKQMDYDFYNLFRGNKGTYNLKLIVKVYDLETKDELCSKTMPVEIIVN